MDLDLLSFRKAETDEELRRRLSRVTKRLDALMLHAMEGPALDAMASRYGLVRIEPEPLIIF